MPTRNVHVSPHFDSLIAAGIESGQFSNASEVVCEGLLLLEQRRREDHATIDWLRGAIQEGVTAIESGNYVVLNTHQDIDNTMDDLLREVKAEHLAEQVSV